MASAISQARIVYIGRTPSRTNNSPLFEVVLKGSRWYVSWRGGRERETIDMGLDALQMRGMEQQAKPDGGYVSSTYAKGRGKYAGERLLLSMEARSRRGGPHSLFTRNTYLSTRGRLSLFRLFSRSYLSSPSPDTRFRSSKYPSSRIFFPENFLPSSFSIVFLTSLFVF